MEEYEKPNMEIVELENEIIMSSLCGGAQENEAPVDSSGECPNDCPEDRECIAEL